ncbi:hypothetical protein [Thiofilum flexile]|uniref:hypothetical protein n=1 Tax=Thiofilum flexile TaxID=125627 RepID=UPI0003A55399|nr:hypothetical protein [Thiofilum flexile]
MSVLPTVLGIHSPQNTLSNIRLIKALSGLECPIARVTVLGAMETDYLRGKIKNESMYYYEYKKYEGSLPTVRGHTFTNPVGLEACKTESACTHDREKQSQIKRLAYSDSALNTIKQAVIDNQEIFTMLVAAALLARATFSCLTHPQWSIAS